MFDRPLQIHYIEIIMVGLLRIILYSVLFYFIYKIVRFFQKLTAPTRDAKQPKQLSGIMVKDETCNTYLPREDAIHEVIGGKDYFFCSKECRDGFRRKERAKKE